MIEFGLRNRNEKIKTCKTPDCKPIAWPGVWSESRFLNNRKGLATGALRFRKKTNSVALKIFSGKSQFVFSSHFGRSKYSDQHDASDGSRIIWRCESAVNGQKDARISIHGALATTNNKRVHYKLIICQNPNWLKVVRTRPICSQTNRVSVRLSTHTTWHTTCVG